MKNGRLQIKPGQKIELDLIEAKRQHCFDDPS
jgi:hypothetical protein